MPSSRAAPRLVLAFAAAFVTAQALDVEFPFLAGLAAISLAGQRRAPGPALLLALPAIGWLLVTASAILAEALGQYPTALAAALLAVFYGGFVLSADARLTSAGLLVLAIFALIPAQLVAAPELAPSVARWLAANVAIAAAVTFAAGRIFPFESAADGPAAGQGVGIALPPLAAAIVLLLAVFAAIAFDPPAVAAAIVGVIVVLRAAPAATATIVRNRLLAAVYGGLAAWFVWQAVLPNHNLAVLAAALAVAAWLLVMRMDESEEARDLALKSINVLSTLVGKGFSAIFDGTDELLPVRFVGVFLGIGFALGAMIAFAALRRRPAEPAEARR